PKVTDVIASDGFDEDQVIRLAGAVESKSEHPLAEAIVGEAKRRGLPLVEVSSVTRAGIPKLIERIIQAAPFDFEEPHIVGDLVDPGDICVLVVPIDLAAPKGRLILPQVQTLRDLLDRDAIGMVVKERELREALSRLKQKPKLVITDSQAFLKVAADTPEDVWMTSFSILFARFKGDLMELVRGARAIEQLQPGDKVLIAEACTHHVQADDIGRVQIPRWLRQYVGGELDFTWSSGFSYPDRLEEFKLVVHCGGCMINRRQMLYRIQQAREKGVPIVNYGVLLAFVHGILERALQPFPLAQMAFKEEIPLPRRDSGEGSSRSVERS
ncbi:MAG: [FeFe] hydrogenase H-cluster maturation GTPase HydF, partial [Syntrophomonadaceae bacterium]|nr:[FeFe] hydrogenase H-cluster maturation GTPase HydF [Syntrophomonadaceae bacterium]